MTDKQKRYSIVAVVVIIILLLLFVMAKKRNKIIPFYDDANISAPDFDPLAFKFGDLIVPDLSFFAGVSACGCDDRKPLPRSLAPTLAAPSPVAAQSIQRFTPPRFERARSSMTSRYI